MDSWGVSSEIGSLELVMVHRPGQEHRWILPWNHQSFLFDDILDVEEAREEHKGFTDKLQGCKVSEVIYILDLFQDICANTSAAREIFHNILSFELDDPDKVDLDKLRPQQIISGLPEIFPGVEDDGKIQLKPTPNLYFTRDPAFAVPDAVVIASPKEPVRRREALLLREIFRQHPRLNGRKVFDGILNTAIEMKVNGHRQTDLPLVEGGDILVADRHTVLIGVGDRTNEQGADLLTDFLFTETPVQRVVKIYIPPHREFMHLDTLMTFVNRRQIITLPYLWDRPDIFDHILRISSPPRSDGSTEGPNDEVIVDFSSRMAVVARDRNESRTYDNVLQGLDKEGIIDEGATVYVAGEKRSFASPEEHIIAALREQWNDAANVLALKPGQVICYFRNDRTQRALENADVEVVTFRGGELVRGRGGARCMTMPLQRSEI